MELGSPSNELETEREKPRFLDGCIGSWTQKDSQLLPHFRGLSIREPFHYEVYSGSGALQLE